jgi:hypothetical protein
MPELAAAGCLCRATTTERALERHGFRVVRRGNTVKQISYLMANQEPPSKVV